uniref:Uncharacterized protein n=1 Tax=Sinocyclocheilus grahami TaxID=75366 RepID=A0A672NW15_SINGR
MTRGSCLRGIKRIGSQKCKLYTFYLFRYLKFCIVILHFSSLFSPFLMTFEFESIGQVIDRLHTLQSINKELLESQTRLEKERESTKLKLIQYINKLRTVLLHCNNQLHQQQTQLDTIRLEAYKWVNTLTHNLQAYVFCTVLSPKITNYSCVLQELKLKHFHSTAAKETLQFAQLKATIRNIYQMITHYRRVSVDTEDTFKQLEMVNNAKILLATLNESLFVNMIF